MLRHPKLLVEAEQDAVATPYGGLVLAAGLVKSLGLASEIDRHVSVLKRHRPFHESDHVLAHVYNLFVGGTCIEDLGLLQQSEAVRRTLGACRLPDPTTAGDFLRRFDVKSLLELDRAIDAVQRKVWKRRYGRRRQPEALLDLDSHVEEVHGVKKQGADFSYNGKWSYHPLIASLANTQECLRSVNRPGNAWSSRGAAEMLEDLLPLVGERFRRVIVRGDSAFYQSTVMAKCVEHGQFFALVARGKKNLHTLAESLPESAWKPFIPSAKRERNERRKSCRKRRRRPERRRRTARRRGKSDLRLQRQWVAEVPYKPKGLKEPVRLVIRRLKIAEVVQGELFEVWRYRFAVTNLPDRTASQVIDLTYQRCDQENIIEQLQNGVSAMRMPTGDLLANDAFMRCGRIAYNLKSWIGQLLLPRETVFWEWKRFRHAFVYIAATVVRHARQVHVRIAASHQHHLRVVLGHQQLLI